MTKHRKHFTAEQKAAIVRQHLVDRKSIADVCEKHGIQPTVFYRWQKQVFDNLPALFEKSASGRRTQSEARIATLKTQLARKDSVIAEITQDYIDAKKKDWGPLMRHWVAPRIRDDVVATVEKSARRAGWPLRRAIALIGIGRDRYYDWRRRRGSPILTCSGIRWPQWPYCISNRHGISDTSLNGLVMQTSRPRSSFMAT